MRINEIKDIERVLQQPNFMGHDKAGCNLAANQIIDRLTELGFEIKEIENDNNNNRKCADCLADINNRPKNGNRKVDHYENLFFCKVCSFRKRNCNSLV